MTAARPRGAEDRRGRGFRGPWAPVAVGDYGIGPNHVLPTGGSARCASALSVRDFQRRHSRVRMTARGLRRVADDVVAVARAEGFPGHAQSVLTRFAADSERLRPVKPAVRALRAYTLAARRARSRSTRTRTPGTCPRS